MLFRFEADAPTVTMQRLKALTTGALPTFVDVADNYGGDTVLEDNLIAQLAANGRRVVFAGDDTWERLYAPYLTRSYPHPSFNVKDLHSNDLHVRAKLRDELARDDWDVLIAHLLGVDRVDYIKGVPHKLLGLELFLTHYPEWVGKVTLIQVR